MRPDLIKLIRELTLSDTKSLSQKALKTVEEVGELASKVLPYEGADGTHHRLVQRNDIAEECVDTILCALSILYELGLTDEQVEDVMAQKSQKWSLLQKREKGLKFPVPFEMHVTVQNVAEPARFRQVCGELGVKPLFLALQDQSGETVLEQVMTSSIFHGDNQKALEEVNRIAAGLSQEGFEVTRRKIETVPWHPAAPSRESSVRQMPFGSYFEAHFNVRVKGESEAECQTHEKVLKHFCMARSLHFSRNIFKLNNPLDYTRMMTLRRSDAVQESFQAEVQSIRSELMSFGFEVAKTDCEFGLFDSNIHEDASWIGGQK